MPTIHLTDGTTIKADTVNHDGKRLYYNVNGVNSVLEDDEYTHVED